MVYHTRGRIHNVAENSNDPVITLYCDEYPGQTQQVVSSQIIH